jgi:hypothetical protein
MKTTVILVLIILMNFELSFSQWIQTDGPYGPIRISGIAHYDSVLLVGTDCGLFRKEVNNDRWNYIANIQLNSLVQNGDSLFIGAENGIYMIDKSKQLIQPAKLANFGINDLNHSDTCLFAGADNLGFLKSKGFSNIWKAYNDGLPVDTTQAGNQTLYLKYVFDIEILDTILYCATKRGVYKSNPTNISWKPINTGLPKVEIYKLKAIHDTLYAASSSQVFYSIDHGNSWRLFYSAPGFIISIQNYQNTIFIAVNGHGVFYTRNKGLNWDKLNTGLANLFLTAMDLFNSTLISGITIDGVFQFKDSLWVSNNQGIICNTLTSLTATNNNLYTTDDKNVYMCTDGVNWKNITPSIKIFSWSSITSIGDTILLSYVYSKPDHSMSTSTVYSTDLGHSWNDFINKSKIDSMISYNIYTSGHQMFFQNKNSIYFSDDLGNYWHDISISKFCKTLYDFHVFNSMPFAATCNNGELIKLNTDSIWIKSNNGIPVDNLITKFGSTQDVLFAYVRNHGMYVSKDSGLNWSLATNGLQVKNSVRSFANISNKVFLSTDSGVYYSEDLGENWFPLNDGLIDLNVYDLVLLHDTLYVKTDKNAIWKRNVTEILLKTIDHDRKNQLQLIYPNPATSLIYIDQNTNQIDFIKIYDLLGKLILSMPTKFTNLLDISKIGNGTYIVVLYSEKKQYRNKLVIYR